MRSIFCKIMFVLFVVLFVEMMFHTLIWTFYLVLPSESIQVSLVLRLKGSKTFLAANLQRCCRECGVHDKCMAGELLKGF
jgi:hypothetical protein